MKSGLIILTLLCTISSVFAQNISVVDRFTGGFTTVSDVEMNKSGGRFYLLKSVVDSVWLNDNLVISGPFTDPGYGATYLIAVNSNGNVELIENYGFNFGDLVCGDSSLFVFISFKIDTLHISDTFFVNSAPYPGHNLLALEYNYSGDLINFKHWKLVKENAFLIKKAIFNNGEIFLSGECYKDTIYLDNHFVVPDYGNADIFVAKMTKSFEVLWLKDFGHKGHDYINDIYCGSNGNILFTGDFGSYYFFCNNDTLINEFALLNTVDMFIGQLSLDGQCDWLRQIKDESYVSGIGSVYLSDGRAVVAGNYYGIKADLGDSILFNPTEYANGFIASYSSDGILSKAWQFGGGKRVESRGLSITSSDELWKAGLFGGDSLDIGGIVYSSNGSIDALLIQYKDIDLPGNAFVYGGSGTDYFAKIERCINGNLLTVLMSNSNTINIENVIYTNHPGYINAIILKIEEKPSSTEFTNYSRTKLEIYPNPIMSDGIIKYHFSSDSPIDGSFFLYSIDGKLINKWDVLDAHGELSTSNLISGLYLIKFINTQGNVIVRRLIIH